MWKRNMRGMERRTKWKIQRQFQRVESQGGRGLDQENGTRNRNELELQYGFRGLGSVPVTIVAARSGKHLFGVRQYLHQFFNSVIDEVLVGLGSLPIGSQ